MRTGQMDSGGEHSCCRMGGEIKFPPGRVISVNDGGLGLVEMLFATIEKKPIRDHL